VPDDLGRWADPALLVLSSLAGGDKHGYVIVQDIEAEVGVRLGPGTLYGVISRLEERRMIEALPADGRRHPYRITAGGRTALAQEAQRMAKLAATTLTRLRTARA